MSEFFIPVFIIMGIILVITLIITYAKTVKMFPLMYVISVFSYACLVTYVMDVYDLGKNSIILLLVVSAALMVVFGKKLSDVPNKKMKYKNYIIIPLVILVVIAMIGIFDIGVKKTLSVNSDLSSSDFFGECGKNLDNQILLATVTVENNFIIPRRVETSYTVCADYGAMYYDLIVSQDNNTKGVYDSNVEVFPFMSKKVELRVRKNCYAPEKVQGEVSPSVSGLNATKLYLVQNDGTNWVDCYTLSSNDKRIVATIDLK